MVPKQITVALVAFLVAGFVDCHFSTDRPADNTYTEWYDDGTWAEVSEWTYSTEVPAQAKSGDDWYSDSSNSDNTYYNSVNNVKSESNSVSSSSSTSNSGNYNYNYNYYGELNPSLTGKGSVGYDGSSGWDDSTGSSGSTGSKGSKGSKGTKGSIGSKGSTGNKGSSGKGQPKKNRDEDDYDSDSSYNAGFKFNGNLDGSAGGSGNYRGGNHHRGNIFTLPLDIARDVVDTTTGGRRSGRGSFNLLGGLGGLGGLGRGRGSASFNAHAGY